MVCIPYTYKCSYLHIDCGLFFYRQWFFDQLRFTFLYTSNVSHFFRFRLKKKKKKSSANIARNMYILRLRLSHVKKKKIVCARIFDWKYEIKPISKTKSGQFVWNIHIINIGSVLRLINTRNVRERMYLEYQFIVDRDTVFWSMNTKQHKHIHITHSHTTPHHPTLNVEAVN